LGVIVKEKTVNANVWLTILSFSIFDPESRRAVIYSFLHI
jgi:hypothetical protein